MVEDNNKDYRIINGDSRWMNEVENESVHLIITSPPYFDLKDYGTDAQIGFGSKTYEEYINNLNSVWEECIRVLVPGGKICINIMPILLSGDATKFNKRVTKTVVSDIEAYMNSTDKMYHHSLYIWDKRKFARFSSFGSYPYPPNMFSTYPYEWITVFSKEGDREKVSKEIKEKSKVSKEEWMNWAINSIWDFSPAKATLEKHPAPFPDELPKRLMKLYSFYGDTVLDPFMGSGTTLKVARQLGRKGIGYEINPEYIALAENKISNAVEQLKLF
ncbi:site-specific DNA-methyltransferase [Bacillus sp. 7586-K]|nr:site-specific DNA-methyltransferase [Bacillus sp. 7586-K]